MSCARSHAIGASLSVGMVITLDELRREELTPMPLVGGGLAGLMGSLPDWIEPANHPNHRQFFHSLLFALGLGYGMKKLYDWHPDDPWYRLARVLGLIAGGAYLTHLAMDACTAKSLPLIGKI